MKKKIFASLVLALLVYGAAVFADAKFVPPSALDFKAILTTAPSQDSEQEKQEMDEVLWLQKTRTPDEIKRAESEVTITAFSFSDVLGSWFNPDDLPITAKLMTQVGADVKADGEAAKNEFGRKRPFMVDPRVKPCVTLETTPSFPSGHSTRATVWAYVLADIFPEHRMALLARARQIGDDRVLAGLHFPSDVEAGRTLGKAIADQMLANPDFQAELEKAKAECMADAKKDQ
jgi:acid phosphatase (class A)